MVRCCRSQMLEESGAFVSNMGLRAAAGVDRYNNLDVEKELGSLHGESVG